MCQCLSVFMCMMTTQTMLPQGYGCPGLSITASAIATAEVARVDASCSTFILVHSSLAMLTIGNVTVSTSFTSIFLLAKLFR